MRSFLVVLCCLAIALWTPVSVVATTCDSICETTDLWGISGESSGFKSCQCSDQTTGAARTGPDCGCGVCYLKSGSHIFGQARLSSGECPAGATACDDCEIASSSGSTNSTTTTTTKTPTSTTTSPTTSGSTSSLTPSSTSSTSGTSGDSTSATGNSASLNATSSPATTVPAASNVTASVNISHGSVAGAVDLPGGKLGSPSTNSSGSGSASNSSSSSSGLATWQIALIICSAVLVIAVVMITITSCYCKARNRMKDNELIEEDTREYEHYWHPGNDDDDRAGSGNQLANSGFNGSLMQGGRSSFNSTHSRPNSAKNVQYEPTYSVDERIGAGRSHRGSLGSNADLPGIYQPFPQRERPSQEVGSRKNISIEL